LFVSMKNLELNSASSWIIIPGGQKALYRQAYHSHTKPESLSYPLATVNEVASCSQGNTFPWGKMKTPPQLWEQDFQSIYGLYHSHWFITEKGDRIGGASNVERNGSGALRHLMTSSAGSIGDRSYLEENEGWALSAPLDANSSEIYHRLQLYAAEHINTDGGILFVSPCVDNHIYVGLGGQCVNCRNRETVTLRQLKEAFSDLNINMFPDLIV
jgi:hypothetical protein